MYINDSGPVSYISWCFSLNLTLNALYSKLFLSFPYLQPRLPYYVSLYVLIPSLLHLSIHFFSHTAPFVYLVQSLITVLIPTALLSWSFPVFLSVVC